MKYIVDTEIKLQGCRILLEREVGHRHELDVKRTEELLADLLGQSCHLVNDNAVVQHQAIEKRWPA